MRHPLPAHTGPRLPEARTHSHPCRLVGMPLPLGGRAQVPPTLLPPPTRHPTRPQPLPTHPQSAGPPADRLPQPRLPRAPCRRGCLPAVTAPPQRRMRPRHRLCLARKQPPAPNSLPSSEETCAARRSKQYVLASCLYSCILPCRVTCLLDISVGRSISLAAQMPSSLCLSVENV